jgi:thioredoxin-like negative regulator of GroEL
MRSSLRSNWKVRLSVCFVAAVVGSAGAVVVGSFQPALAAPDVFSVAKSKYEKKEYQGALNDFKALSAKYPNNALCHYYMALCNQCLTRVGEAKSEYQWVIANDRGSLSRQAAAGLNQLSGGKPSVGGQVKMVLDFYTTWCGPCKQMEPAFEAAKSRYTSISFKRYDAEAPANAALVKQFAVQAYPTIVMIDGKGKVLFNQAGSLPGDELAQAIDQVNGK